MPLVASPYFAVEKVELHGAQDFDTGVGGKSSAQILVVVEGAAVLSTPGHDPVRFSRGDAVVVPASIRQFRIQPETTMQFLKSYVPGEPVPQPETFLD